MQRSFLFLQGVISPLFPRLADALASRGHRVLRINFCAGDALAWGRRPAINYRGEARGLEAFYARLFERESITDLVLFGDERPVHRPAIELAGDRGIAVHVFEEGYLRPHWFTLERQGVNANSRLPRDPDWYRATADRLPPVVEALETHPSLAVRAGHDVLHHLANLLNPILYPGYRTHRPETALREYLGWAWRFAPLPLNRRRDAQAIAHLTARRTPYFLLPLQLNADAQVTHHSAFRDMREVLGFVLASFARHAPGDASLVIKNHPLDTGLAGYRRFLRTTGSASGAGDRLVYLETGHLPTLLDHAAGVVTVNSTTGISALLHGAPTIALGQAIYDLAGLTFQGSLDDFWVAKAPPDPGLLGAFRKTVLHCTQVNGDLYSRAGIAVALESCLQRLEGEDRLAALLPAVSGAQPARRVSGALA